MTQKGLLQHYGQANDHEAADDYFLSAHKWPRTLAADIPKRSHRLRHGRGQRSPSFAIMRQYGAQVTNLGSSIRRDANATTEGSTSNVPTSNQSAAESAMYPESSLSAFYRAISEPARKSHCGVLDLSPSLRKGSSRLGAIHVWNLSAPAKRMAQHPMDIDKSVSQPSA